jgi:hypothetical protein
MLLAAWVAPSGVFGQSFNWQQTNGPYGGRVMSMARFDGLLYAGTNNGVYVSEDNGLHWRSSGLQGSYVSSLMHVDSVLLAGLDYSYGPKQPNPNGIYRLVRGEAVWIASKTQAVNGISAMTRIGQDLFASSADDGYHSTDHGETWVMRDFSGLSIASNDKALLGQHYFESLLETFPAQSTDKGYSWKRFSTLGPQRHVFAADTGKIIAGRMIDGANREGGLWRLQSGGAWSTFGPPIGEESISALAIKDQTIFFAADTSGVRRSMDDGETWVNVGLKSPFYTYCFLIEEGVVYAGTSEGVFYSSDNGDSWQSRSTGLQGSSIARLIEEDGWLYALTESSIIHRSSDNGDSWSIISSGLPSAIVYGFEANTTCLVLALGSQGMYRSTDHGDTWNQVLKRNATLIASTGSKFIARAGDSLFLSTDDGATWTWQPTNVKALMMRSLYANGPLILAGSYDAILRSVDDGHLWLQTFGEFSATGFTTGAKTIYALSNSRVISSSDEGYTFSPSSILKRPVLVQSIAASGEQVFIGSRDSGIYFSADDGVTIRKINDGLEHLSVKSIEAGEDHIFAGTGNGGVYRASWVQNSVSNSAAQKLSVMVTPNPARRHLRIEYDPQLMLNSVRLISPLGNTVFESKILDELTGELDVDINPGTASGAYILELQGQNETVRETVIIK